MCVTLIKRMEWVRFLHKGELSSEAVLAKCEERVSIFRPEEFLHRAMRDLSRVWEGCRWGFSTIVTGDAACLVECAVWGCKKYREECKWIRCTETQRMLTAVRAELSHCTCESSILLLLLRERTATRAKMSATVRRWDGFWMRMASLSTPHVGICATVSTSPQAK